MRLATWNRRHLLAVLVAGSLVGLGACGDDADDDADDGSPDTTEPGGSDGDDGDDGDDGGNGDDGGAGITISGFAFEAGDPVAAGATVAVTNDDGSPHTVTSDDDLFDVQVSGGESGDFTAPAEAGSYTYHCEIHSSMTGTLVVE